MQPPTPSPPSTPSMGLSGHTSVRVACRFRPNNRERDIGSDTSCVTFDGTNSLTLSAPTGVKKYDSIYSSCIQLLTFRSWLQLRI